MSSGGAMDAFLSYSRRDIAFVLRLHEILTTEKKAVWFDQVKEPLAGLPPASKWWDEIQLGIANAANFMVVLSPHAITSPYCNAEIAYALKLDKRFIVVIYCGAMDEIEARTQLDSAIDSISSSDRLPSHLGLNTSHLQSLARRNWLELDKVQYIVFSDKFAFGQSMGLLLSALDRDLAWIRTWSAVKQTAQLWAEDGFDDSYLWSERRLLPVRKMIEERGQVLTEIERRFLEPEQERLLAELHNPETSHSRRASIGDRLAFIGDSRPGVDLRADGLPEIAWVEVPAGTTAVSDEVFPVGPFYIARYPITCRQYQAFVEHDEGLCDQRWWSDVPEDSRQGEPVTETEQLANYPRDKVSWWHAVAFARWLTVFMPDDGWPRGSSRGMLCDVKPDRSRRNWLLDKRRQQPAWQLRLPTEWEWQWAAQGENGHEYPWGEEWDSRFANVRESGLHRTIAVGMYPEGATPTGILDLSGNLWEWCMNTNPPRVILPREVKTTTVAGGVQTVREYPVAVRGGSFDRNHVAAACEDRDIVTAGLEARFIGFRLVCANTELTQMI